MWKCWPLVTINNSVLCWYAEVLWVLCLFRFWTRPGEAHTAICVMDSRVHSPQGDGLLAAITFINTWTLKQSKGLPVSQTIYFTVVLLMIQTWPVDFLKPIRDGVSCIMTVGFHTDFYSTPRRYRQWFPENCLWPFFLVSSGSERMFGLAVSDRWL